MIVGWGNGLARFFQFSARKGPAVSLSLTARENSTGKGGPGMDFTFLSPRGGNARRSCPSAIKTTPGNWRFRDFEIFRWKQTNLDCYCCPENHPIDVGTDGS